MTILNVSESSFATMTKRGVCVVKFGAKWCGPCKAIEPKLEAASANLPGVKILGVDIDECPRLVQSMTLRKVPTIVVMKAGVEVARKEGMASESDLLAMVQDHL